MFNRDIKSILLQAVSSFSVVVLTRPRQSDKTTLLKSLFPKYHYLNLEFPDVRELVGNDPRGKPSTDFSTAKFYGRPLFLFDPCFSLRTGSSICMTLLLDLFKK